jgi:hypothetical protein
MSGQIIFMLYSNCDLTSNLFSIRNRQHNLFCLKFLEFLKLVRWFLWIKYNNEKKYFVVRLSKMHNKVLCLSCALEKRTTKFYVCRAFLLGAWQSLKKILASFYLCTTNTLVCIIYFNLVLISTFLLFLKNLFHWKDYFRLSQIWTTSA